MASIQVGSVSIKIEDIETPFGLRLASIESYADAVTVDTRTGDLQSPDPARISVLITAEALRTFLETEKPGGLAGFEIKLEKGQMRVRASRKMIIDVPVLAVCTLQLVGGEAINVVVEEVEVLKVNLDNFVRTQIEKINPVFKTEMLPFPATLTGVEIDHDGIHVRAHAPVALPLGR